MTAGPSRTQAGAVLLLAAVLLALGWSTDAAGRLLALAAAAVAAGLGGRDLLLRPVLRADRAGVQVVVGLRRLAVPWSQVERLRLVADRRTPLLELDLGSTLVVLSRLRLGRPPAAVLAELEGLAELKGLAGLEGREGLTGPAVPGQRSGLQRGGPHHDGTGQ